jgi:hypothetical protein
MRKESQQLPDMSRAHQRPLHRFAVIIIFLIFFLVFLIIICGRFQESSGPAVLEAAPSFEFMSRCTV